MHRFITNQEKLLSELLGDYIPNSKQLDFLVGYFYFSGFYEISKQIKDKNIRILVGMEADVTVNHVIREWIDQDSDKSQMSISILKEQQRYLENITKIINQADVIDTKEGFDSLKYFIEKLKDGTLEVRKTKEPCHAKIYIFTNNDQHSEGGEYPGKVIIGSSNLSYQGLKGRMEINATMRDKSDHVEAVKIFDDLWSEAIPLVDESTKDEFLETIIKHTWIEKMPSPFLMYIRVLYEYFNKEKIEIKTPASLTHTNDLQYMDLEYQTDAIKDGIEIIKRHSGCIVADVVGLGKSIIGVTIAANLDLTTIIICPPHLKMQWDDFAFSFGLRKFRIVSSGKIEDALIEANKSSDEKLIIVDEAHRYRNEDTLDYALLHQTCIGNKVLLLSATPYNNRPQDIFSLIKLFQIPAHSTIQTFNNLSYEMEQLIIAHRKLKAEYSNKSEDSDFKEKAKKISSQIRDMLDPVLIRRTRVDLLENDRYKEDLTAQGIEFSDVEPPEEQEYELGTMSELYLETLNQLSGVISRDERIFIGARYSPLTYLKDDEKILDKYRKIFGNPNPKEGQRNMASFMRQLLVRRFESSIYSFIKTLENIINSMINIKNWYNTFKKIPLYKRNNLPDFDSLNEMVNEELDNSLFFDDIDEVLTTKLTPQIEKGLIMVNADELTDNYIIDLEKDIALFQSILSKWKSDKYNMDPKFDGILSKIKFSLEKDPIRKIIIFSEFKDTVEYLYTKFAEANIRVLHYTSQSKGTKNVVKDNFDAGLSEKAQKNEYDLLVATDAISEGFSLHRAGTIYNYDIPYNPTRVIQRVGRINRINKKVFEKINIYNFFPSATGEEFSGTKRIATFKMLLIQAIFGSDTKILTADEITEGYLTDEYKKAKAEAETPSWQTEFENILNRIKNQERDIFNKALEIPPRCRIGRKLKSNVQKSVSNELFTGSAEKGVTIFSKKGDALRFTSTDENGKSTVLSPLEGILTFKAELDEKALPINDSFYPLYERSKTQSGTSTEKGSRSKNLQELNVKINYILSSLKKNNGNKTSILYLEKLRRISNILDSLPLFYIRELLDISTDDIDTTVKDFKNLVNENYIDTILDKERKIKGEVESILLAEQFQ